MTAPYRIDGQLTAAGGVVLAAPTHPEDCPAMSVWLSGNQSGGRVGFEIGYDAEFGPWFPVQARRATDGVVATDTGVIGAQTAVAWTVPTLGAKYVRLRCLALTSGAIDVVAIAPAPTFDATPAAQVTQTSTQVTCLILGVPGPLTVQTGSSDLYLPTDCQVMFVVAGLHTAPTVSSVVVDVNKNGTSIFTTQANRPTIAPGQTYAVSGPPDITALTLGDFLSADIDQIGNPTYWGPADPTGVTTVLPADFMTDYVRVFTR